MEGGDPPNGEVITGVLCAVLCFSVQERHRHTGENSAKGQEDDERTGTSLV